jgi:hypothetical protein
VDACDRRFCVMMQMKLCKSLAQQKQDKYKEDAEDIEKGLIEWKYC